MMNHNEPIVKACGDANRTATKKGPRGTNNNLIINNIYVSPRKKRFYYNCKYLSEEITKKKKVATALEEKQRLIEEILQLPHQVDNSFTNIIRMIMFFLYKYKSFHNHGEHAFRICYHQEVDSAIAGFEPGSQPPRSAAEILLATLAQV